MKVRYGGQRTKHTRRHDYGRSHDISRVGSETNHPVSRNYSGRITGNPKSASEISNIFQHERTEVEITGNLKVSIHMRAANS